VLERKKRGAAADLMVMISISPFMLFYLIANGGIQVAKD